MAGDSQGRTQPLSHASAMQQCMDPTAKNLPLHLRHKPTRDREVRGATDHPSVCHHPRRLYSAGTAGRQAAAHADDGERKQAATREDTGDGEALGRLQRGGGSRQKTVVVRGMRSAVRCGAWRSAGEAVAAGGKGSASGVRVREGACGGGGGSVKRVRRGVAAAAETDPACLVQRKRCLSRT